MSEYKCQNCKENTKEIRDASGTMRCTNCGHKLFFKIRQPVAKRVKAI